MVAGRSSGAMIFERVAVRTVLWRTAVAPHTRLTRAPKWRRRRRVADHTRSRPPNLPPPNVLPQNVLPQPATRQCALQRPRDRGQVARHGPRVSGNGRVWGAAPFFRMFLSGEIKRGQTRAESASTSMTNIGLYAALKTKIMREHIRRCARRRVVFRSRRVRPCLRAAHGPPFVYLAQRRLHTWVRWRYSADRCTSTPTAAVPASAHPHIPPLAASRIPR